jgi:hypothetical protein
MALSGATFSDFGGAVSDLFAASADRSKAAGLRIEGQEYTLAAGLATQNAQYTQISTNIKEFQAQRDIFQTLGKQQADVASSGFQEAGSALDLLRDSAQQGALNTAVLGAQGQIQEAGYEEQAASYTLMAQAASMAATASDKAAQGATIAAGFRFASALFSFIPTAPTGSS